MKLRYTDDTGKVSEWDWNPGKMGSAETEALEEVGGRQWSTYEEFADKFMRGSQRAYRAAVWINLRRLDPSFRFETLSITPEQVELGFADEEMEAIRQTMLHDPDLTETDRADLERMSANQFNGGEPPLDEPSPNSGSDDSKSLTPDSLPVYGS